MGGAQDGRLGRGRLPLAACGPVSQPQTLVPSITTQPPAPLSRDTPGRQTGETQRLQLLRESGLETSLGIVTQKHRLSTEPPGEETRGDLSRRAEHGLERHRRGPREKGELGMAPEAHTSLAALIRLRAMEEKGWGCVRLPQTGTTASRGSLPISHL